MLLQATDLTFGYLKPSAAARLRTERDSAAGERPVNQSPKLVIDGVSLEIDRSALVGILGPNGSGKTTLLKLLSGTLRPVHGEVRLDGVSLARVSRGAMARRCAVVPQDTKLAFEYTVLEIALMGRYPHLGAFEIERPEDLASAIRALDATGTSHLAERAFQTLSGGERQRVVIASALAQIDQGAGAPDRVLFLDEPTASLDLKYQIEIANLIRRLHRQRDIAVVLSTHDLQFAAAVCSHVVLLSEGRVLAQGPPAVVLTPERLAELYGLDLDRLDDLGRRALAVRH